jgi:hypothetical protein
VQTRKCDRCHQTAPCISIGAHWYCHPDDISDDHVETCYMRALAGHGLIQQTWDTKKKRYV